MRIARVSDGSSAEARRNSAIPRIAAFVSVLLAGAGVAVGVSLSPIELPTGTLAMRDLLLLVAALLALGGGALALLAGGPSRDPDVSAETEAAVQGLQIAVHDLRDVIHDERTELASLRDICNSAAHGAMTVGARLASVAMNAEARLAAGVEQTEQMLLHASAAVARSADGAQFLDRAVPELAELITRLRRGQAPYALDARPDPHTQEWTMSESGAMHALPQVTDSAVRARLAETAEAAVQTIAAAAGRAAEQISALGTAADMLRRDAMALDMAGREVANSGADVIGRLGNVARHADAALGELPRAIGAVRDVAEQAGQTLAQAQQALVNTGAVLSQSHAAIDASGHEANQAAIALHEDMAAFRSTGRELAGTASQLVERLQILADQQVLASLATLPELTSGLSGTAATLRQDSALWQETGRKVCSAAETVAATLSTDFARTDALLAREAAQQEVAARVTRDLAGLPEIVAGLADTIASLRQGTARLTESGEQMAAVAKAALTRQATQTEESARAGRELHGVSEILERQAEHLVGEAARLHEAADRAKTGLLEFDKVPDLASRLAETAAALQRHTAPLAASERQLHGLVEKLSMRLDSDHERGIVQQDAGRLLADELGSVSQSLVQQVAQLQAGLAPLPGVSSGLVETAGQVRRDTARLAETGQAIVIAMDDAPQAMLARASQKLDVIASSVAARLDAVQVHQAEHRAASAKLADDLGAVAMSLTREAAGLQVGLANLTTLPAVADTLAEAAAHLQQDTFRLAATGQHMAGAAESMLARLAEGLSRGEAALTREAALQDVAGRVTEGLARALTTLDRDAIGLEQGAARIAAAAAQAQSSLATLEAVPAVAAGLAESAAHFERESAKLAQAGRQLGDAADMVVAGLAAGVARGTASQDREAALQSTAAEVGQGLTEALAQLRRDAADIRPGLAELEKLPALTSGLADTAAALQQDIARLAETGREVAGCAEAMGSQLSADRAVTETAAAREAALQAAAAAATEKMSTVIAALSRDSAGLVATTEAAVHAVNQAGGAAAIRITDVIAQAEAGMAAIAALPALTAELTHAAATLQHDTGEVGAMFSATGREVVSLVQDAAARLTAELQHTRAQHEREVALQEATAQAARELTAASAVLCRNTATLEDSAGLAVQSLVRVNDTMLARITELAAQAPREMTAAADGADLAGGLTASLTTSLSTSLTTSLTASLCASISASLAMPLAETAATLSRGAQVLDDTGHQVTASVAAMVDRLVDQSSRFSEALDQLPDATGALSAACAEGVQAVQAAAELRRETTALLAAGHGLAETGETVLATFGDTAARMAAAASEAETRAKLAVSAIATLPRLADTMTDAITAMRLDAASFSEAGHGAEAAASRAEAAVETLQALVAGMADAAGALRHEASHLAATARQVASSGAAAANKVDQSAIALDAGGNAVILATGAIASRLSRLEDAVAHQDDAARELAAALTAALAQIANIPAAGPVANLEAVAGADEPMALHDAPVLLQATLHHFGGVQREAQVLLREAETLAEAVMTGHVPALPPLLAGRAPALLAGVEHTIQRLRSVATALALASDGPPSLTAPIFTASSSTASSSTASSSAASSSAASSSAASSWAASPSTAPPRGAPRGSRETDDSAVA